MATQEWIRAFPLGFPLPPNNPSWLFKSILSAIYECSCLVLLSLCLDIIDFVVVLYLYLVKLLLSFYDVFFFFFLLPVMANKDEYINYSNVKTYYRVSNYVNCEYCNFTAGLKRHENKTNTIM